MSVIKAATAIACEYVAQGHMNKHTLVNIYGGDILTSEFPATFPIAFYLELIPSSDEPIPITIHVQLNKKTIAHAISELPALPKNINSFVVGLPAIPVEVTGPSEIRVIASVEGQKKVTLLTKKIRGM